VRLSEKPDCETCRSVYELDNERPPCGKCIPALMPENQKVYGVYRRVCGQHIMGQMGPIDIMIEPIFRVMSAMDIDEADHLLCLDLIQKAYHEILNLKRSK